WAWTASSIITSSICPGCLRWSWTRRRERCASSSGRSSTSSRSASSLSGRVPEEAVAELLDGAEWRPVILLRPIDEGQRPAEFLQHVVAVVAPNLEPAALQRPVRGEGGEDHDASGIERGSERAGVGGAVFRGGQEVEDRAIVPEVVAAGQGR